MCGVRVYDVRSSYCVQYASKNMHTRVTTQAPLMPGAAPASMQH